MHGKVFDVDFYVVQVDKTWLDILFIESFQELIMVSWYLSLPLSGKMKDKGHQKEEQRFSMILGTMLCVMLQHGCVLRDVLKKFSWNSSCL